MTSTTRADLVALVAKTTGIQKSVVNDIVMATFSVLREEADAGQVVKIAGFGQFAMKDRAARIARNPRTGEPIEVPARKVLAFKPSKTAA